MPSTSEIANKLADDLVAVGKILGFESVKEAPVLEGSTYRVDVLWELSRAINVASIEIQYSNSPTSISHNIFKTEPTLHPAIHVVISYNELTADYKEILNLHPGVILIEGKEEIDRFNGQISRILNEPNEAKRVELGNRFLQSLKSQKKIHKQKEKLLFDLWLERLFEPVVYEITIFAHFFEGTGTLCHTFFVTGTIEEAKSTALKLFEEKMTDVPFEWDAKYLSLKSLEITCYQLLGQLKTGPKNKQEGVVYKVAINGKIGNEENHFEFTDTTFGQDAEEVEKTLFEYLNAGVERMKSVPHNIFEQNVYVAKYLKIKSWNEPIKGEVSLVTREIPPKEEQKKMLKKYFNKEFGLDVEEFLSLDDICSTDRYSENLDYIKRQLCEMLERNSEDFRVRMREDDFRRLKDWLSILW